MARRVDSDLIELAEAHRDQLPAGFLEDVDSMAAELAQGRSITSMRTKGRGQRKNSNVRIRAAILEELSLFLCSDDPRYDDLRGSGRKLTKDVANFIAGVVVGTLGIASGVATACVAFVAIACLRIGVGAFCRLNPPAPGKPA